MLLENHTIGIDIFFDIKTDVKYENDTLCPKLEVVAILINNVY